MLCVRCHRPLSDDGSPCPCTAEGTGLPGGLEIGAFDIGTIAQVGDATLLGQATILGDFGLFTMAPRGAGTATLATVELETQFAPANNVSIADCATVTAGESCADFSPEDQGPLKVGQAFGSRY